MKHRSARESRSKSPATITLTIIICAVALMGFITILKQSLTPHQPERVDAISADTSMEARVMSIASRFICNCGSCGGEALDQCDCASAIKTRGMIRAALLSNRAEADIIQEINSVVGGIRQ